MDVETTLPARPKVNGRMWQPGQSGNPACRPVGARGRFSEQFIADLTDAWQEYGATALRSVAGVVSFFVGPVVGGHLIRLNRAQVEWADVAASVPQDKGSSIAIALRQLPPDLS